MLGFGSVAIGGLYGESAQQQNIGAVQTAYDRGIFWFDTSPFYANSEEQLGIALKELGAKDIVISTKAGREFVDGNDGGRFDFSPANIRSSLERSMNRIGVNFINLYIAHDVEFAEKPEQIIKETIPAMRELQQEGKIGYVGFSGYPLLMFPAFLEKVKGDFILTYAHHCLHDSTVARLIPYLKQKGVGILGGSPTGLGLLTERGPQYWHPAPDDVKAACASARDYCKQQGISFAHLSMQFALGMLGPKGIGAMLMGTSRSNEVLENIAAFDTKPDETHLKEVLKRLEPIQGRGWKSGLGRYDGPLEPQFIL